MSPAPDHDKGSERRRINAMRAPRSPARKASVLPSLLIVCILLIGVVALLIGLFT